MRQLFLVISVNLHTDISCIIIQLNEEEKNEVFRYSNCVKERLYNSHSKVIGDDWLKYVYYQDDLSSFLFIRKEIYKYVQY